MSPAEKYALALEACRLLAKSYVEEAGTYALGELSEARKAAERAIALAEQEGR